LVLNNPLAEEVVAVEKPVGPDGDGSHPDRTYSSQPPIVGLRDEVRVVKHQSQNNVLIKIDIELDER
jgi:hypothetical protein